MRGIRSLARVVSASLVVALLLGGMSVVPAFAVPAAFYNPQYVESPAHVLNDHTGFGMRWAADATSTLPDGQYYVKLLVSDNADVTLATEVRGFTWNPVSLRWVKGTEANDQFPTVTASGGVVSNQWTYGKAGDERVSGMHYLNVALIGVADGIVHYAGLSKQVNIRDAKTNAVWVHNGTERSDVYKDSDVTGKRVAVLTDDASTTNGDPNYPPTAPTAALIGLWECQRNLIDDDSNGVVDDEGYGLNTRTVGDYRIGVPLNMLLDIYVNRNQTAKGGLLINDFYTGTAADVDLAIGASEIVPPTAVTDLAAAAATTQVNLSWTSATDNGGSNLAGYRLYRWQDTTDAYSTPVPSFVATLTPEATSYVDHDVLYGEEYNYELRAFDNATNFGPRSNTATVTAAVPNLVAVYRLYNSKTATHFYTASLDEANGAVAKWPTLFAIEGVAYLVDPWQNSTPLYRFYNNKTGTHFYTASEDEKRAVLANWPGVFTLEGVAYNVSTSGGTPVYRFYNNKTGAHFYTASLDEANAVKAKWPSIFTYEGIGFYLAQAPAAQ
jgi:hypothetical protein